MVWKNPSAFRNKRPVVRKLLQYGFTQTGATYRYCTDIAQGDFSLKIEINEETGASVQIIDKSLDEEYALAYAPSATGAFVGAMHAELESVLADIAQECFETDVFKSREARAVIAYIRDTYAVNPEFLWEDSPEIGVFRDAKTQKWFGVMMRIAKQKIGLSEEGTVEILNLKADPDKLEALIDGVKFFRVYHMNKKHWVTVRLDDARDNADALAPYIDASFNVISKKSR